MKMNAVDALLLVVQYVPTSESIYHGTAAIVFSPSLHPLSELQYEYITCLKK